MKAFRVPARVTQEHTLRLDLPEGVVEGPAEVIILIPESPEELSTGPAGESLDDFLAGPRISSEFWRSKDDIDREVNLQRDSWE